MVFSCLLAVGYTNLPLGVVATSLFSYSCRDSWYLRPIPSPSGSQEGSERGVLGWWCALGILPDLG